MVLATVKICVLHGNLCFTRSAGMEKTENHIASNCGNDKMKDGNDKIEDRNRILNFHKVTMSR